MKTRTSFTLLNGFELSRHLNKSTLENQIRSLEAELDKERALRESLQQELEAANQGLLSSLTSQKRFTVHLEELVRRRTEEASRARDEALAASRAKSEFLATMSHEIRTPMNAIVGFTQLLLQSELTPKQRQQVTNIDVSGRNLLQIINDILDFSKIEAGKLELEFIDFDLFEMCEQIEKLYLPQARSKGLDFRFVLDHKLPPRLNGDSLRINQVITNLISNALKFTGEGAITLMARVVSREGNQCEVEFSCQDTGVGILPEYQDKLFSAFTQADGSTTRQFGGTGLGLSICKKLIEKMGGSIWVSSKFGHGSTFYFRVPLAMADHPEAVAQSACSLQPDTGLENLRVLLVEDNEINQELALEILASIGVSSDVAFNGLEALEKVKISDYDLIFMDMQMPLMDGLQTTRRIRTDFADRSLFVVAMTANASNEDRQNCLDAGMDDFMAKPISIDSVLGMLDKAVRNRDKSSQDGRSPEAIGPAPGPEVLNVPLAMSRMGNRDPLFRKMITMFANNYHGAADQLKELLTAAKWEAAQGMTHSLKGVAANIAAEETVQATSELDHALKQILSGHEPDTATLALMLDRFSLSLERLLQAIHEYRQQS